MLVINKLAHHAQDKETFFVLIDTDLFAINQTLLFFKKKLSKIHKTHGAIFIFHFHGSYVRTVSKYMYVTIRET